MSADRVGTHTLALTQELLAQMWAPVAPVSRWLPAFRKAGFPISYTLLGNVTIVDRPKLEEAMECSLMQRQTEQWQKICHRFAGFRAVIRFSIFVFLLRTNSQVKSVSHENGSISPAVHRVPALIF